MGRIVVSENVSLDGVIEDPTGEEGFARAAATSSSPRGGRRGAASWRSV